MRIFSAQFEFSVHSHSRLLLGSIWERVTTAFDRSFTGRGYSHNNSTLRFWLCLFRKIKGITLLVQDSRLKNFKEEAMLQNILHFGASNITHLLCSALLCWIPDCS